MLKEWITGFTILDKYPKREDVTVFVRKDILYIFVNPDIVNQEDMKRLEDIGFLPDGEYIAFYKFGD